MPMPKGKRSEYPSFQIIDRILAMESRNLNIQGSLTLAQRAASVKRKMAVAKRSMPIAASPSDPRLIIVSKYLDARQCQAMHEWLQQNGGDPSKRLN